LIDPLALFGILELKEEKGEYDIDKLKSFRLTDLGRTLLAAIVGNEKEADVLPLYNGDPSLN